MDQVNDGNRTSITKSLTGLDGVENVNVDLESKKVTVRYDEAKVRLVDIKQTIMEKGYSVIEI
ncbi:heavy-metal-associated domain-containing protein [Petroclostridium sp. X23]|uniref:heavy-metal-associated domain-containing protein n=1 Tax=Petroclostridium sp. X23 TaxID=3045146 RepID=UPI0024AE08DC|nr:heavy-metal-associated domain-containing protein [Petroclostridium sp. X23]WHH58259.1 heavy-metal-associated domain-containing protein [Petroclostridium sp. X23]